MHKGAEQQVTLLKFRSTQIRLGKVRLLQGAVFKTDVFQLQLAEEGELEHAVFKRKLKQECPALTELHAEQFAATEFHLLQAAVPHFCKAEVTPIKPALSEGQSGEIGRVEVAVDKSALLILAQGKRSLAKVGFFKNLLLCDWYIHAVTYYAKR